mmetsp:Transcript_1207/g.2185  ORF Transcript_1207/g.2185 Transcript_1207/m.2185 type:complete len:81 (+) Transcript_1207:191-433(+)
MDKPASWPYEYFKECKSGEEERLKILELIEMVEKRGEVPPIVKEWVDEWMAYSVEHEERYKEEFAVGFAFKYADGKGCSS